MKPAFQPPDEPLGERAQLVLVAMLELGAVDSDRRQSTEAIAFKALGADADANALKTVMAELKSRGLIESKTGRGGGCWLTDAGKLRAEKLRAN
ncbi:MAG TPA: Rrf2 family transcriptional regulator [Phycisphaerae bacterium]|nr:Rrf2 family transcriptional regulator [Phycisphaerae bacterium]